MSKQQPNPLQPQERQVPEHDLDAVDCYTDSETGDVRPLPRPAPKVIRQEKVKADSCCPSL